jgi:hypothetical protein
MIIGGVAGYAGAAIGASVGASAIAGGATTVEAGIAGGMMGGMASGAINGAGMTALAGGSFSDVMGGMTQGAVMGGFAGALSGGVGAAIGDFSGVAGSGFKNAMYELGHSTMKGAAQGLAGGAMMAAMNQDASYLWKGAALGGAIGGGMAGLRIATMGPTFIPDQNYYGELEDFGQVYRSGSFLTPKGSGIALGRTIVYKAYGDQQIDRALLNHEVGHIRDIQQMGAARFYGRTAKEYGSGIYKSISSRFMFSPRQFIYNMNNTTTLEYRANIYAHSRLGYFYNYNTGQIDYYP